MGLTDMKSRSESRKRKAQIEKELAYRRASRRMNKNEKSVEKLIDSYRQKAAEAQRMGSHTQAVHFAAEAAKLEQHLAVNGQMRNTVDTVYALGEGSQALIEAMEVTGQLADGAMSGMDPDALSRAQLAYEMNREQVEMLMDQADETFSDLEEEDDAWREKGENYLRSIVRSRTEAEKKRRGILQDTNRKLDELLKNRASEKQDGAGG